jgi:hypothetical protein
MPGASHKTQAHGNAASERFSGGRVRGSLVRAHSDWVRDHCDRHEVVAFFEAIPPSMRSLLIAGWYRFEDFVELDRVIVNQFGDGDVRFLQDLGAFSARQYLSGAYRLLQDSGVHEFFHRSVLLRTQFYDFGRAEYFERAERQGQMIHSGFDSYSPLYCSSAVGFYRECLRLHGGRAADVCESRCQCRGDDTCTFELFWT